MKLGSTSRFSFAAGASLLALSACAVPASGPVAITTVNPYHLKDALIVKTEDAMIEFEKKRHLYGAIEQSGAAEQPIEQVADGTSEHEAERHRLDPSSCVAEHVDDQSDDAEGHDGQDRPRVGEDRERRARVVRQTELEEVGDQDDVCVGEGVDRPPLRELIDRHDRRGDGEGDQTKVQMRFAASTVVVA